MRHWPPAADGTASRLEHSPRAARRPPSSRSSSPTGCSAPGNAPTASVPPSIASTTASSLRSSPLLGVRTGAPHCAWVDLEPLGQLHSGDTRMCLQQLQRDEQADQWTHRTCPAHTPCMLPARPMPCLLRPASSHSVRLLGRVLPYFSRILALSSGVKTPTTARGGRRLHSV